jgi:hypothetical protein
MAATMDLSNLWCLSSQQATLGNSRFKAINGQTTWMGKSISAAHKTGFMGQVLTKPLKMDIKNNNGPAPARQTRISA